MSHIINALLRKAENLLSRTRIRLFKTAYVNFRTLPFKQAVKWPIFIYGRVKLYNLSGQIEIRGPVERGMIKFGYRKGYFSGPKGSAMLFLAQNAKLASSITTTRSVSRKMESSALEPIVVSVTTPKFIAKKTSRSALSLVSLLGPALWIRIIII